MKKITLFALLLLLTTACAKKNAGVDDNEPFGLGGDPVLEGEIVLPEETPPEGSTIPEDDDTEDEAPVVCEPVDIITTAFHEETPAGDDYRLDITTRNPCIHYACELASGPDWLTMTGCRLEGRPNTAESLGEHRIQVRIYDSTDNTNADVLDFTLTVRDEPEIVPYVSRSCGPAKGNGKEKKGQEVLEKNAEHFEITQRRAELCLRIDGYADEYEMELGGSDALSLERINGKLFRVTGLEDDNAPLEERLTLSASAVDRVGHEAYKEFRLTIHANPCDTPLSIEVKDSWKETDDVDLADDEVVLGSKYRVVFEVTGGDATDQQPFVWNFENRVTTDPAQPTCDDPENLQSFRAGACAPHPLETNPNWVEIVPEDEAWGLIGPELSRDEQEQKRYFQMETRFAFPGKDLPYDITRSNDIFEWIHVAVRSPLCEEEKEATPYPFAEGDRNLRLDYQLPNEGFHDLVCEQQVQDVGDTASDSRARLIFKRMGEPVAMISYNIHECRDADNETHCEEPKSGDDFEILDPRYTGDLDEIDRIEILFEDNNPYDSWCLWDCDNWGAEYDLIFLSCHTKYRDFIYYDGTSGRINNNVVPAEDQTGFDYAGLVKAEGNGLERRTYELIPDTAVSGIWSPRLRPDYSAGSTE